MGLLSRNFWDGPARLKARLTAAGKMSEGLPAGRLMLRLPAEQRLREQKKTPARFCVYFTLEKWLISAFTAA